MKQGAYHYANKPFNLDEIALLVEKALETTRLRREVRALRSAQAQPYSLDRIVGDSDAMVHVRALLKKIAAGPASTVLLTGESGTGKDLAAKVHSLQQRPRGQAVHEHHLLGAAREPARERAVRARARRVHRRGSPEARAVRDGRRRHGVSRRNRRDGAGPAGQAAAVSRGADVQAGRRVGGHPRGRARDRGHQPQARGRSPAGTLPRGPVLPAQRGPDRAAAAARAGEGHPAARSTTTWTRTTRNSRSACRASRPRRSPRLQTYGWPGNIRELRNAVERAMLLGEGKILTHGGFLDDDGADAASRRASSCRPTASISSSSSARSSSRRSSGAAGTRRAPPRCSA